MIRGTTPTLEFILPFEVSIIQKMYITFSQNNTVIFELTEKDCNLSESTVTVTLTQEQTLLLDDTLNLSIQMRVLTTDNVALASEMIYTNVDGILKDGEI